MEITYIDAVADARAESFRALAFSMRRTGAAADSIVTQRGLDLRGLPVRAARGGELCPQAGAGTISVVRVTPVPSQTSALNSIPGSATESPPV